MPKDHEEVKPPSEQTGGPPKHRQTPMPWLKLWTEILTCAKFWRVTEVLRARWFLLLICACKADREGLLQSVDDLAVHLRLPVDEMQKTLAALAEARLLLRRGSSYWIHDWADWQVSRSPAAEKQKRYRERRNALRNALPASDVTGESRVTETRARARVKSQSQNKTQNNSTPSAEAPPRSHSPSPPTASSAVAEVISLASRRELPAVRPNAKTPAEREAEKARQLAALARRAADRNGQP